ncbi:hypothetical protein GGF50DRAFT_93237, partial [Schizophyllum commune]
MGNEGAQRPERERAGDAPHGRERAITGYAAGCNKHALARSLRIGQLSRCIGRTESICLCEARLQREWGTLVKARCHVIVSRVTEAGGDVGGIGNGKQGGQQPRWRRSEGGGDDDCGERKSEPSPPSLSLPPSLPLSQPLPLPLPLLSSLPPTSPPPSVTPAATRIDSTRPIPLATPTDAQNTGVRAHITSADMSSDRTFVPAFRLSLRLMSMQISTPPPIHARNLRVLWAEVEYS